MCVLISRFATEATSPAANFHIFLFLALLVAKFFVSLVAVAWQLFVNWFSHLSLDLAVSRTRPVATIVCHLFQLSSERNGTIFGRKEVRRSVLLAPTVAQ